MDAGEYAALGLPRMADQPVVDCQLAASKIVQLVSVRARFDPAGPNLGTGRALISGQHRLFNDP